MSGLSATTRSAASTVQFRLLGPLEVVRDGVALELGPPKQRAVLAALLVAEGGVVGTDRLIEAVWGNAAPPRAGSGIQVYISRLRTVLQGNEADADGVRLVRRPPGYVLTAPWVDTVEFRRLTEQALAGVQQRCWSAAAGAASAAAALWRGPFLDDLAGEPWVSAEAARLDEASAQCAEARVTGLLGQGRIGEAVTRSQALTEAYPLREHCWWLSIVALHRAGRSPEALDTYTRFAADLDEQLGLEPGPELRNLQTAILRHDGAIATWPAGPGEPAPVAQPAAGRPPLDTIEPPPTDAGERGTPVSRGPLLVGREHHLAVFDKVLDGLAAGDHPWVLVTGRAGMGKTRLATEAVARAGQRGIATVWTTCPDDHGVPAWWSLRPLVTALGTSPDQLFTPPPGVDADTVRYTIYERISGLLQEGSTSGPLLVVIDDAQWLDAASLRCLSFLVRTQRIAGVGIVLTVRDREQRPEFDAVLATIGRESFAVHLPVEPLDGAGASQLLRQVGGDTISAADAFALMRRIGGNPLLLTEYARLPADERRSGQIPVAARGVLERRLRRLPEDVLVVLRAAAVLGDAFELDLLAALTDLDLPGLIDRLDAAADDAIIEPATTQAGYQFRHGLLRDAVLAQLTVLRRQALHARAAHLLAGRGTDPHTLIVRAGHLSSAMPIVGPAVVVAACSAAATAAERVWDWDAAAQQWDAAHAAAQLAAGAGPMERERLLLARLVALARAGRGQTVLDTVNSALEVAAAHGHTGTIGRLAASLLRTSGAWPWPAYGADPSALLARLDELVVSVSHEPAAHARVLAALAVGHCYHPDPAVPDAQSRQALAIAEQLGDPDLLADAIVGRVQTYAGIAGHATETIELLDRLATVPHTLQDTNEVLRHNLLTMAHFSLGDPDATAEHLRAGIIGSDRLRLPVTRVQLRWVAAMLAEWSGDLDQAERLTAIAYELHQQTELYGGEVTYRTATLSVRWQRGCLAQSPDLAHVREPLVWQALAAAEVGDPVQGRDAVRRRLSEVGPEYWYTLAHRVWLGHAVADLGLAEFAPQLIEQLADNREMVASLGQTVSVGPVSLATGKLRGVLGDLDGARADLAIAERQARAGCARGVLLRVRLAQLSIEPPGPARSAALREIAARAEELGMRAVAAAAMTMSTTPCSSARPSGPVGR